MDGGRSGEEVARHFRRGGAEGRRERSGAAVAHVRVKNSLKNIAGSPARPNGPARRPRGPLTQNPKLVRERVASPMKVW
jgi:hypothetical protein